MRKRPLLVVVPVLAAAVTALLPGPFASAASTSVALEGEGFTVLSGRAAAFADTTAYGEAALLQRNNGTVTGTVETGPVQELVLRLRGDQYRGAPQAVVRVDGRRVATLSVSATRWTGHRIPGAWPAGRHQVEVSYVNDLWVTGGGDRNLRLDRITFHATSTATPSSADATYEARLVQLVNIERVKAGLRPLAVSACADRYAGAWSASMAASDQLVHRSNLGAVMSACGARGIGENIAFGNVTADRMMAMWMGSTGHRANILRASYTHIGVGIARTSTGRVYGTQNFLTS